MSSIVSARDVPIDIADSCKCCWGCCMRSGTVVYINKSGEVERFSRTKSPDHVADHTKSVCRIKEFIGEEILSPHIDIGRIQKLRLKDIRVINEAISKACEITDSTIDELTEI